MLTNDATILKIKHEVNYEAAKLAYEGTFDEKKDDIAYRLAPGPKPNFRCCVYKEREIIRQRVRLAEGLCPNDNNRGPSDNIMQVIDSACADCPLSHYIVTDNCRKCMAKACQQSCKFGAITMGRDRAYIDPDKCKECGMCAKSCPYNAIADLIRPCKKACPVGAITMDENGICVIDDGKCIRCGKCIHRCPFGAIGSRTDIVNVIKAIKAGKKVVAMFAPAMEGQFGPEITMESIRVACRKLGFYDMIEVGLGGDMTAAAEADEWLEAYEEGKKKTTSCCPAFVNMIKKHYPELAEQISTTVSPMCAVSRLIKAKNPDAITVFVGPCIAKKDEAKDKSIQGNADYVLTIGEFRSLMRAKSVKFEAQVDKGQQASVYGKRFGNGGGVTAAVIKSMEEIGADTSAIKVEKCAGADECKKALLLLKAGRLDADFIEGMMCEGGCVGGPSQHKEEMKFKKDRDKLIGEADARGVRENLENYDMKSFRMHK
ncbi:MAG: 4Fe-4S dicluster domain-containing protein [Lachnospira sp.]|nr:4Fe-4S dicluster domain-containing protein [Lachnospira sp.]